MKKIKMKMKMKMNKKSELARSAKCSSSSNSSNSSSNSRRPQRKRGISTFREDRRVASFVVRNDETDGIPIGKWTEPTMGFFNVSRKYGNLRNSKAMKRKRTLDDNIDSIDIEPSEIAAIEHLWEVWNPRDRVVQRASHTRRSHKGQTDRVCEPMLWPHGENGVGEDDEDGTTPGIGSFIVFERSVVARIYSRSTRDDDYDDDDNDYDDDDDYDDDGVVIREVVPVLLRDHSGTETKEEEEEVEEDEGVEEEVKDEKEEEWKWNVFLRLSF
ncbi:hypothetical protein HZH68_015970 [Vespula germanica]|uniref:Uncharacterized protein n=1 Tax=Vespula germanica TaxID=30212 RepID=A0A834MQL4_VESGE|nr:hypothetical protein HZH68_015970 [Vespula germanica]